MADPSSIILDIKSLFESSGFTAVAAGLITAASAAVVEYIRSKHSIKVERVKLFERDRIDALKRLIEYAQKLSLTLDPEDYPDMKHYNSTYNGFGKAIALDAAFHTPQIIDLLEKIARYSSWWNYSHLDDSYETILEEVRSKLPTILSELVECSQKQLHALKLR